MKYITLIIGLLVVGCGTPVKELTLREKAIGTYEGKDDGDTIRSVFLENGIVEVYVNGKKKDEERDYKWTIVNGEIQIEVNDVYTSISRINPDKSITFIAYISNGYRADAKKRFQATLKKIK